MAAGVKIALILAVAVAALAGGYFMLVPPEPYELAADISGTRAGERSPRDASSRNEPARSPNASNPRKTVSPSTPDIDASDREQEEPDTSPPDDASGVRPMDGAVRGATGEPINAATSTERLLAIPGVEWPLQATGDSGKIAPSETQRPFDDHPRDDPTGPMTEDQQRSSDSDAAAQLDQAPDEPTGPKSRAQGEYTVQSGDTLSSIAAWWYGDESKWTLLAEANGGIDPRALAVGQHLTLPATGTTSADAGTERSDTATGRSYTVKSGDTLSAIARRLFNDSSKWRLIYEANREVIGSRPDDLRIGMRLKLPESLLDG